MAEIDKSLPNTKTTIEIPGQTEIEQTIQEEIQPTDSSSCRISNTVSSTSLQRITSRGRARANTNFRFNRS